MAQSTSEDSLDNIHSPYSKRRYVLFTALIYYGILGSLGPKLAAFMQDIIDQILDPKLLQKIAVTDESGMKQEPQGLRWAKKLFEVSRNITLSKCAAIFSSVGYLLLLASSLLGPQFALLGAIGIGIITLSVLTYGTLFIAGTIAGFTYKAHAEALNLIEKCEMQNINNNSNELANVSNSQLDVLQVISSQATSHAQEGAKWEFDSSVSEETSRAAVAALSQASQAEAMNKVGTFAQRDASQHKSTTFDGTATLNVVPITPNNN